MLNWFYKMFSYDLAIDLGTTNTLVYVKNKGIIVNEPSVVAIQKDAQGVRTVRAIGKAAKEMLGRSPTSIEAVRPIRDGVIADFDLTEKLLRHVIELAHSNSHFLIKPRAVICIPYGITDIEKKAVRESAELAGCSTVHLIEEPLAAALGADLLIHEASGNMIVNIGGGTTEVAVISLYGIAYSKSIRMGGDKIDEAIINYLKRHHNIIIGERTAEQIKISIGSAYPEDEIRTAQVKGRDLISGVPRIIEITNETILKAMQDPIKMIVEAVHNALEFTPPELAADIVDKGIMLVGGGALIHNIDTLLQKETGLPIFIAENHLTAVVLGAGKVLADAQLLKEVTY